MTQKRGQVRKGGYASFLASLKARVAQARTEAARTVNAELVKLYWDIGKGIVQKQTEAGWGESVVERLAADLQEEFPDMRGFSASNLWLMRQFYSVYSQKAILEQLVQELHKGGFKEIGVPAGKPEGKPRFSRKALETRLMGMLVAVPWGHHVELIKKVKQPEAMAYYLKASAKLGWSRNVLMQQVKASAFERAVKMGKANNFGKALPAHFAEQAEEMMKSSYNLEFLGLGKALRERDLEDRLIGSLQAFILELGYGFCFVGRQYRLALGRKEYFVDLLFYHRFLRTLVAFDLKLGPFEPEHAGKMDFYLNLLNDQERAPEDKPSIGIILCAEKDDIEVEYALRTKANPIGVAQYELERKLPAQLRGMLPSERQLSSFMRKELPKRR